MKLAVLLEAYRLANGLGIRELAAEIGLETTALFRFMKGKSISNRKWVKLFMWLLVEDKHDKKSQRRVQGRKPSRKKPRRTVS